MEPCSSPGACVCLSVGLTAWAVVRTSLVRSMVSTSGSDPCADGEGVAVVGCSPLHTLTEL